MLSKLLLDDPMIEGESRGIYGKGTYDGTNYDALFIKRLKGRKA